MIFMIFPMSTFPKMHGTCPCVGRSTLEMGVDSAIISFNFGASRLLDVFKEYGLQDALYTNTFCRKKDISRINESCRKESCTERIRGQGKRKGWCCVWTWYLRLMITLFFMFYAVFKTIYLTLSVVFLKTDILQNSAVHNFKTVYRNCIEFSGNVNPLNQEDRNIGPALIWQYPGGPIYRYL